MMIFLPRHFLSWFFLSVSQIFSYEKWSAAGPPQYLLGNPNFKYNPMMWAEYVEDKRMENGPALVCCMWEWVCVVCGKCSYSNEPPSNPSPLFLSLSLLNTPFYSRYVANFKQGLKDALFGTNGTNTTNGTVSPLCREASRTVWHHLRIGVYWARRALEAWGAVSDTTIDTDRQARGKPPPPPLFAPLSHTSTNEPQLH